MTILHPIIHYWICCSPANCEARIVFCIFFNFEAQRVCAVQFLVKIRISFMLYGDIRTIRHVQLYLNINNLMSSRRCIDTTIFFSISIYWKNTD